MDLSRIKIDPRLRTPWEAIDLGFVMARKWWLPLALSWAIPSFFLFIVVTAIFPNYPLSCFLLVWWLKPLWDRLPIMLASRALFSEPLEVKGVLRRMFSIFRRDWFSSLTWRRFSPTRSYDIPIGILEGLRGAERSRRLNLLHQKSEGAAIGLTLVCFGIEYILAFGLMGAVFLLIPIEVDVDWASYLQSDDPAQAIFLNFLYWLCVAALAPFYTVAGFALYICRRIELEGWDIEIRFRHLIMQHQEKNIKKPIFKNKGAAGSNTGLNSKLMSALIASAMMGMLLATTLPQHSWAQTDTTQEQENKTSLSPFVQQYYEELAESPSAQRSKDEIIEILSGDDFYQPEKTESWRWKREDVPEVREPSNSWLENFFGGIRDFVGLFLGGFEILFWLLIGAVIAFVIYRFRDALSAIVIPRKQKVEKQQTEVLFGLDVRQESLPDNITEEVDKLWQQGQHREALGLLYRATLSGLIYTYSFEFFDGYTEQECVDVVSQRSNERLSSYVKQLTRVWQLIAYAHQTPDSSEVQYLCSQWSGFFVNEAQHAS